MNKSDANKINIFQTEALDEYLRYQSIPQMIVIRWHHFTVRHFTHTPVKYTFALKAQELAQHLELLLYNCISLIFNTFSEVCHFFTQIGVSHLLRETSRLLTKLMRTLGGALSCTLGVAHCLSQESFFLSCQ